MSKDMPKNTDSNQMSKSPFLMGVLFTLLGGSLWGFSGTSVQYLTTEGGVTPALVTFMRVLVGGGILFVFIIATRRNVVVSMI